MSEFRGVWITTVYNIDWPKVINNELGQKEEFLNILDKIKSLNIDNVFVQVRAASDSLYKSNINPWSKYLTGTQGLDPGYDPLQFMIVEAHKRNIKFHAWINPYRVTTKGTDLNKLDTSNPARLNPNWILQYDNSLFYDPENKYVQSYIQDTIHEIITNYWVDGIHFDDYFYPYNYPLPLGESRDGTIGNNRRDAINELIRQSYKTIKSINKNIEFGVSPFGIWKNKSSDIKGSETDKLESYYGVYADSLKWIDEGTIDYISPQLYFNINQVGSDYEILLRWWNNIVQDKNIKLYIGQGIYKDEIAKELEAQIKLNRKFKNVNGNILFSFKDINNNLIVNNTLETVYK